MIPIEHYLIVSALLFCIGLVTVVVKKHAIMVLIGIELMLNAANLNLIAFSRYDALRIQGQAFSLFVIVVAAAEAAVALAIIFKAYHFYQTSDIDKISELKG